MGVLAIADLILGLMGKANLAAEEGLRFWRVIKAQNPADDLPDRTDAEVIAIMKAGFTANKEEALAKLAALDAV